jgi:hypothetical protein
MIDQMVGQLTASAFGGGIEGIQGFSKEQIISGVLDAGKKKISNSGLTGSTITDKMALKYDGPDGVRSFTMNHKFIPRSSKESSTSKEIVKLFRTYSSPALDRSREVLDQSSNSATFFTSYKFPSLFKVVQMAGEKVNKNYPQYDLCYCKSVKVKYGDESGNTFHGDNSPVSFEIDLSFEEIAITNRETIEEGY